MIITIECAYECDLAVAGMWSVFVWEVFWGAVYLKSLDVLRSML